MMHCARMWQTGEACAYLKGWRLRSRVCLFWGGAVGRACLFVSMIADFWLLCACRGQAFLLRACPHAHNTTAKARTCFYGVSPARALSSPLLLSPCRTLCAKNKCLTHHNKPHSDDDDLTQWTAFGKIYAPVCFLFATSFPICSPSLSLIIATFTGWSRTAGAAHNITPGFDVLLGRHVGVYGGADLQPQSL